MKKGCSPRKKYANGSSNKGIGPSNYIPTPGETLADYNIMMSKADQEALNNPWLPIVGLAGGLAQNSLGAFIPGSPVKPVAANGNNNVKADVEVEGGEMYETPQGDTGEFQGPSHEEGGIPMEVNEDIPEGTKIYSDRLKVGDKTLAERKAIRDKQISNLEKTATQPLLDSAIKNATKRKMEAIQKEEAADLQFQEQVNNMQQMADNVIKAFGTSIAGVQENPVGESMRYANGTNKYGILPGFAEGFGTDSEGYSTDMYSRPIPFKKDIIGSADYNTNIIQNFQNDLGMDPNTPGYGKVWGPKSKELYKKKGGDVNIPTQKELLEDPWGWATDNMDITKQGYKFNPQEPDMSGLTPTDAPFVEPTGVLAGMEKTYQEGKAAELAANPSGTVFSRGLSKVGTALDKSGSMPSVGDLTGLFGDYLGATSGLKNAAEQRSTDVAYKNPFINAGKESQKQLDSAMSSIESNKNQAIIKATTTTQGGKRAGRNSARGVNQMRGMDWLYDTALNQQIAEISANAANQVSDIHKTKANVALSVDQLKGTGEQEAAKANEAAKDAYYTAKGLGLKDQSLGVQNIGKDINAIKQNKMVENLMQNYGKYVSIDKKGNLANKNKTTVNTKNTVEIPDGKGGKISMTSEELQKLMSKLTNTK